MVLVSIILLMFNYIWFVYNENICVFGSVYKGMYALIIMYIQANENIFVCYLFMILIIFIGIILYLQKNDDIFVFVCYWFVILFEIYLQVDYNIYIREL